MPRRGRHRTSLPVRLIAVVTALLVAGAGVVVAGSAFADDDGDGGILSSLSSSKDSGSKDSDDDSDSDAKDSKDSKDSDSDDEGSDDDSKDKKDEDRKNEDKKSKGGENGDDEGDKPDESQKDKGDKDDEEEFPGRDDIAPAGKDDFVDITQVRARGNIGEGGVFAGGSYTVDCGVSDHNNSDNYMAAPGKRNGAQHVHDYVGNKTTNAFTEHGQLNDGTSCGNGDQSTFFWPVLRDLNGRGPDVGEDGGSLDGNVGRILTPRSADITFHGHPGQESEPLPQGLMMIMGNAKAKKQDGDNANAKYTCSGFENRVTSKYPVCPAGSQLKRYLDYPSCWDGKNLESKDFRSHIFYPDSNGQCDDDQTPVPQLRITLTYDQPAGRAFSIDSFPDNQHDPSTDHSDYENAAGEDRNDAGAACINSGQRCRT